MSQHLDFPHINLGFLSGLLGDSLPDHRHLFQSKDTAIVTTVIYASVSKPLYPLYDAQKQSFLP